MWGGATISQSGAPADDIFYEAKDVFELVSSAQETTAGSFLSCNTNKQKMPIRINFRSKTTFITVFN